jgi:hypothetical protein
MTDSTNTTEPAAMSPASAGSVGEPVAWGLLDEGEVHAAYVFEDEAAHTLKRTGDTDSVIVPLYTEPPQDRLVQLPRWVASGTEGYDQITAALDAAGVKWEIVDNGQ